MDTIAQKILCLGIWRIGLDRPDARSFNATAQGVTSCQAGRETEDGENNQYNAAVRTARPTSATI